MGSSAQPMTARCDLWTYAGVFLVALSSFMLEILLTRIVSVVAWYHLAFFVIGLAMLGMTAGALLVFSRSQAVDEETATNLERSALAFALSATAAVVMTLCVPLSPISGLMDFLALLSVAALLAVPFAMSGITLTLALTRSHLPTERVYGLDLIGAAAGCVLIVFVLDVLDAPSAVLLTSALAALGSLAFGLARGRRFTNAGVLAIVLFGSCLANAACTLPPLRPSWVKGRREFAQLYEFIGWNSHSRVTVSHAVHSEPTFWGKGARAPLARWPSVEQRFILIDGEAGTVMVPAAGSLEQHAYLKWDVTSIAHALRPKGPAAVIGVGGGRDVLAAASAGHESVVGIELNRLIVDLHEKRMRAASGLAALPNVTLVADEARSFLARDTRRYSVIAMALVDTWASTGAGAYALSENGLYTLEAWRTFMERLEPNGVLSVSRAYYPVLPNETARMLALALATVWERGARSAREHVLILQAGHIATLLVSRTSFSAFDVALVERVARERGFNVLMSPERLPEHPWLRAIALCSSRTALEDWAKQQRLDLAPAVDERPFFFNTLRMRDWLTSPANVDPNEPAMLGNLQATQTLLYCTLVSVLLTLAILIIPRGRGALAGRHVSRADVIRALAYFALIGFGFMCVEIGFLSRLQIFLGHPTLALAVLLGGLVFFTGMGSLLSRRIDLDVRRWALGYPLIPAALIAASWSSTLPLTHHFEQATLAARIAVGALLVALPAVGLGLCFPLGLRLVERLEAVPAGRRSELGPWLWGVNGAFGVCGSNLGLILAMTHGVGATLLCGALCYALLPALTYGLFQPVHPRRAVPQKPR